MNTTEFLQTLSTENTEFNNLKTVLTYEQAIANKTESIYFLSGVKAKMNKRAKDDDIGEKRYFVVDIDLRNQFPDEITNEEIIFEGQNILDNLEKEDELLGSFRHVVFSGNGLHIYYTFDAQVFNKEVYAAGVQAFYENWNEFWGDEARKADNACKNIGRILRLPGSINQKNGAEVVIIGSVDRNTTYDVQKIGTKIIEEAKKEKEREAQELAEKFEIQRKLAALKTGTDYNDTTDVSRDIFKEINTIPAYLVSMKLLPQFKFIEKNGRNFLSDEPKKGNQFTAFYYSESTNSIVNGGSSWYNWGDANSRWCNSNLVYHQLGLTRKETIQWFKNNFKI